MEELNKTYSPREIESKWYKIWEDSKYFTGKWKKEKRAIQ